MAADVKWIKVYTDMVSNKKIKRIRTLPEGNNIVLIWVFLLAQAGECNKSGALYLTDTLPFRTEDLAVEFDFEIPVINLAIITLEKFSMIEVFDEVIYIKNWGEYQNIDGLEKIKEQTRNRVSSYREKQRQLTDCNVTGNVTVTQGNATELELELDIDKDIDISSSRTNKFADDAIEISLASELFNLILGNNPEAKKPNLQTWAKPFDLMIRVDKRGVEDIQTVMNWSQRDSFWQGNILSPSKLRDKYDQLTMRMKSVKQSDNQPNRPKGFDAIDQWAAMTEGMDEND